MKGRGREGSDFKGCSFVSVPLKCELYAMGLPHLARDSQGPEGASEGAYGGMRVVSA